MPAVVVDPKKIKSFRNPADFEAWLSANHASAKEIWLKIHRKGSGKASITAAEALDVALCWGWIDGIRKGFDESSFLQRYSPRRSKSVWSQINRDNVARLAAAGRMTPHGQRHVDTAKADGRWDAAYAGTEHDGSNTAGRSTERHRLESPSAGHVPAPQSSESVRARFPHQCNEDSCWTRSEDR